LYSFIKFLILKFIRLICFLKGLFHYLTNAKKVTCPKPPANVRYIGFFDSDFLIHVSENYTKFFNPQNLYLGGYYKEYKKGIVDLVIIEGIILIRKAYKGSLKRRLKFYNEIKCLSLLSQSNNIPGIYYIDYDKLIIYLEYINGNCLQIIINSIQNYPFSLRTRLSENCKNALKKIHKNNTAVIDIQPQNIIYNSDNQDVFFVDFADSVCDKYIPRSYMNFLQKLDESYLSKRVLEKLV